MAIKDDREAWRAAQAIFADVASGDSDAADFFVGVYSDDDRLAIGRQLTPMLVDVIHRWNAGDRTPETVRLYDLARAVKKMRDAEQAVTATAAAERAAERRAAAEAAIEPTPDIADRMTRVGLRGLPLPDDAEVGDDGWARTLVAPPAPLMAFYIAHLRALGWSLDLDNSNPSTLAAVPQCFFSHPDVPDREVQIITGPAEDDPTVTRLLISELED